MENILDEGEQRLVGYKEDGERTKMYCGGECLSTRLVVIFALLYLGVADFLFFAGWTTHYCSMVFLVGLSAMLVIYYKESGCKKPVSNIPGQKAGMVVSIIIMGIFFIVAGVVGWFPTHGDSWAFRQALFLNLKDAEWPLVLPNGREMSYYLAGMLPSAIMGRMLPDAVTQWAVWLWIMGALIIMLLAVVRLQCAREVIFTIMALGFQDPLRAIFRPNATFGQGRGFMAELLQSFQNITGVDCSVLTTYYGNQTLMAPLYNCVGAYNSVPATLLAAVTILLLRRNCWMIPLVIALLVPISPLGAIACMPVAVYYFFSGLSWRGIVSTFFSLLIVAVSAVYFLRADSSMNVVTFAWIARGSEFWVYYVRYMCGACILLLQLYPFRKNDGLYWTVIISVILIPCVFIGSLPDLPVIHGFNELFHKGSVVYSLLVCLMWCQEWKKINMVVRVGALSWAVLSTSVYCWTQIKGVDANHAVADMWNGHLLHNRAFLNQSVPETKAPVIPGIILQSSGESRNHMPGSILPAARGVDYTRPPHPQAFP